MLRIWICYSTFQYGSIITTIPLRKQNSEDDLSVDVCKSNCLLVTLEGVVRAACGVYHGAARRQRMFYSAVKSRSDFTS